MESVARFAGPAMLPNFIVNYGAMIIWAVLRYYFLTEKNGPPKLKKMS